MTKVVVKSVCRWINHHHHHAEKGAFVAYPNLFSPSVDNMMMMMLSLSRSNNNKIRVAVR